MPLSPASFVVYNGRLRHADEALVDAHDGLVVCGRGIFETIAAYRGNPFHAAGHLERLRRGAAVLELAVPDEDTLLAAMHTALEANGLIDAAKARLRLTLSSPRDGSESWWIEATPPPPHPATARVITGPFFRNERSPLAGLKTINYGDNVVALRLAREAGADEALFANTRDELCEGTWSNIFVRIDGTWRTPPLSSGCLPGITRRAVIGLFEEHGLPLIETTVSYAELDRVESAFLTSSLREIQPIAAMDGRDLESDTQILHLAQLFSEMRMRTPS